MEVSRVMGVPPVLIQVMDDHNLLVKHIETHGDLGIPHDLRSTNPNFGDVEPDMASSRVVEQGYPLVI